MTLHVYMMFHLNLAFSSIEEETRSEVVRRCYWPLLELAERQGFPLALEASGYTLSAIDAIDPEWTATLKHLIRGRRVEFVGSGLAQVIGPLVPASVNRANLRFGHEVYERLLGQRPSLGLVNEQAYSGGLVPLYAEAGYRALIMDYDNCAPHHPEWPKSLRYAPQRLRGADGTLLDLIWTNTIAFQKAQRLAHGELSVPDYLAYVASQAGDEPRAFALYGNDAEVFDFRPGRLATEAALSSESEWARFAKGLAAARDGADIEFILPSQTLDRSWPHRAANPLVLETPAYPIPVKKQHKYNITRWAVTGRDDLDINTRCYSLAHKLSERDASDDNWRELVVLWSSDFRTHITAKRWTSFLRRLSAFEEKIDSETIPSSPPNPYERIVAGAFPAPARRRGSLSATIAEEDGALEILTSAVHARFNLRRGLALASAAFAEPDGTIGPPLCGTLRHGHFDDVLLAFDWYSGTLIYDRPAQPKVTDLAPVTPEIQQDQDGSVLVTANIRTPLGPVQKKIRIHADAPVIDYDIALEWSDWGMASLRLGNFTLWPASFDRAQLLLRTQNGGDAAETFALASHLNGKGPLDYGAPVSLQVSASCGLGLTGGWAELGDKSRRLRITVDQTTAAMIGLLTLRAVDGSYFCRMALSGLEFDETRKPSPENIRTRRFKFSIGRA